jgi:hypothetical protein
LSATIAAASVVNTPTSALVGALLSPTGYACALILCFCLLWSCIAVSIITYRSKVTGTRLFDRAWVEWDSYLVSSAHTVASLIAAASYATLGPVWASFLADAGPAREDGLISVAFGTDPARDLVLASTAGYLLYDLVVILLHQKEFFFKSPAPAPAAPVTGGLLRCLYARVAAHPGLPVLIHHTVVISTFAVGLTSRMATYYMAALIPNEASTIFVNANYFMAASRHSRALTETTAYKANGVLLLVVFFLCRVYHNSLLSVHALIGAWPVLGATTAAATDPVSVLAAATLTAGLLVHVAVNLWWFRGILTAVLRKLSRSSAAPASAPAAAAPTTRKTVLSAPERLSAASSDAVQVGSFTAAGDGAARPCALANVAATPDAASTPAKADASLAGRACALGEIIGAGDTADARTCAGSPGALPVAADRPSECVIGIEGVRAPTPTDADGLRCRR